MALINYNHINQHYRHYFTYTQIDYENALIDKIKENPKSFHQYIRNKKVSGPSVGPLKRPDGALVQNCGDMADIFADSFASVFKVGTLIHFPHQVGVGSRHLPQRAKATPHEDIQGGQGVLQASIDPPRVLIGRVPFVSHLHKRVVQHAL